MLEAFERGFSSDEFESRLTILLRSPVIHHRVCDCGPDLLRQLLPYLFFSRPMSTSRLSCVVVARDWFLLLSASSSSVLRMWAVCVSLLAKCSLWEILMAFQEEWGKKIVGRRGTEGGFKTVVSYSYFIYHLSDYLQTINIFHDQQDDCW